MELVKGRLLQPGQVVQVYQNLNRDCFSIRDHKSGLVVAYANSVTLKDCTFKVSEAGRKRVLERKVRSVHAFVKGEFVNSEAQIPSEASRVVYYNPYTTSTFIDTHTQEPVLESDFSYFSRRRVYLYPTM